MRIDTLGHPLGPGRTMKFGSKKLRGGVATPGPFTRGGEKKVATMARRQGHFCWTIVDAKICMWYSQLGAISLTSLPHRPTLRLGSGVGFERIGPNRFQLQERHRQGPVQNTLFRSSAPFPLPRYRDKGSYTVASTLSRATTRSLDYYFPAVCAYVFQSSSVPFGRHLHRTRTVDASSTTNSRATGSFFLQFERL